MIKIKAHCPTEDEIFIPKSRELPSADIPAVELTERQAAEQGWAFRKKSKSVRITNYLRPAPYRAGDDTRLGKKDR